IIIANVLNDMVRRLHMNILYVTLCSIETNNSSTIRNNALITGIILNGHQVDILTIPSLKSDTFYDNTLNWDEDIKIIRLESNKVYNSLTKSGRGFLKSLKKK